MCDLYSYSVVAQYSLLIRRKALTAVNIDVMTCCDVTSYALVQRWEGDSASIFDVEIIRKNFIVPTLAIVALGQWLSRLMFSFLKMDTAGCPELWHLS